MSQEKLLSVVTLPGCVLDDVPAVLQAAANHLWMHASPWQALMTQPDRRLLVAGHGCTVVDAQGREYLDALSGLWLVNVGHGREAIAEAMARQAKTLAYASASRAVTLPAVQLATLLAQLTPGDLSTVLFSSGGSEAVESALKITRHRTVVVIGTVPLKPEMRDLILRFDAKDRRDEDTSKQVEKSEPRRRRAEVQIVQAIF